MNGVPSRPCPMCGSAEAFIMPKVGRILRLSPGEALLRCAGCDLVRRDPPLGPEAASDVYDDAYYRQYEQTVGMTGDLGGVLRAHMRKRLAWVESRIGVGRMLEIGCGKGYFLAYAKQRGWSTYGVEVSAEAGEVARESGLDVYVGPIEGMPQPSVRYDFIQMNHVLEHLADPIGTLRRLRSMLTPQGLAVIEVPNEFGNLFFRLGRLALPEKALAYPIRSTHQIFFDPRTFRRALTQSGLAIMRYRTIRWTIGDRSGKLGRAVRWAVYALERPLGRAANIEAVVRQAW